MVISPRTPPITAAEKAPDPPGQTCLFTTVSSSCGCRCLAASTPSCVWLFWEPGGQRRDLEDKCRSSLGSLLTQVSHQHHAPGFVQTLKTGALPILNMRRETLEGKRAMCFSHTHKHIHTACLMLSEVWRKGKPSLGATEIARIAFAIWNIPLSF